MQIADVQSKLLSVDIFEDFGPTIHAYRQDELCEDIVLNPDSVLWAKRLGVGWIEIGTMDESTAHAIITNVAGLRGIDANPDSPIVETVLPTGERFQGVLPPLVKAPTFAIRMRAKQIYTLEQYVADDIMTDKQMDVISTAIACRKTIITSGGTGSGKTTLLNAELEFLARLDPRSRIAIIEDTPELQCSLPNRVEFLASDSIPMLRCLKSALRMIPDRIIVGEVRGAEALDMLKAFNTGHEGGLASVHGNDARAALAKLETLTQEAIPGFDAGPQIAEGVQIVVHIDGPKPGVSNRKVREILAISGYDRSTGYRLENL